MEILELRALRGPSIWSRYPVIHMLLDLGEMETQPSDKVEGFYGRTTALMPTLVEHRCSVGTKGGFLQRIERGTWMGHIVEHVAIELQCLAGMEVGFGKTRKFGDEGSVYTIVFRYRSEEAGLEAGRIAVNLVESLIAAREFDLEAAVFSLKEIREDHMLGPSTRSIVKAAQARDIPFYRLNRDSFVQLGWGSHQRRIQATMTSQTSALGVEIADEKGRTKSLLKDAGIPVPEGYECDSWEATLENALEIGYPVVVKPLVGNHGRGITLGITNDDDLKTAYAAARMRHDYVIVEKHLVGFDHRLLVIDYQLVAAARRVPAFVTGDGTHTIGELVQKVNEDPLRGYGHQRELTMIGVDAMSERLLSDAGLTMDSILEDGVEFFLKSTSNLSQGGTAVDITDQVHPDNRYLAERVARLSGLDIVGIDVVTPTLDVPLHEASGGIVEINAAPGFRMHLRPSQGKPRDVATPVIDMLFPSGSSARVPLIAVTGTNGKTTTVRLLSYILKRHGHSVGMTSTEGVWFRDRRVAAGDYSGPAGARMVLQEPSIDSAVLEVARGGILRRGLGYDAADCAIVLNVGDDHIGTEGVFTIDDLAKVKAVVADAVRDDGWVVLNAEDERVRLMTPTRGAKTLFFALNPTDETLVAHTGAGGTAITVEDNHVVFIEGDRRIPVVPARDIPLTYDGRVAFNLQNALAAAAAAYTIDVTIDEIRMGLLTFNPTVQQNPGRMNMFQSRGVTVLIDYGHNVPAMLAIQNVIQRTPHQRRIVVCAGTGSRTDDTLIAFGRAIGAFYSRVHLRDSDPRRRTIGETTDYVRKGLDQEGMDMANVIDHGASEFDAIAAALNEAKDGDFVHLQVDDVDGSVAQVQAWRRSREVQEPSA